MQSIKAEAPEAVEFSATYVYKYKIMTLNIYFGPILIYQLCIFFFKCTFFFDEMKVDFSHLDIIIIQNCKY